MVTISEIVVADLNLMKCLNSFKPPLEATMITQYMWDGGLHKRGENHPIQLRLENAIAWDKTSDILITKQTKNYQQWEPPFYPVLPRRPLVIRIPSPNNLTSRNHILVTQLLIKNQDLQNKWHTHPHFQDRTSKNEFVYSFIPPYQKTNTHLTFTNPLSSVPSNTKNLQDMVETKSEVFSVGHLIEHHMCSFNKILPVRSHCSVSHFIPHVHLRICEL